MEHKPNSGYVTVIIKKHGKWVEDSVRVSTLAPYTPYSLEDFTTAPTKRSTITEPPREAEVKGKEVCDEKVVWTGEQCKLGDFVVIPASVWDDIQRDSMPYTIARCIRIYKEEGTLYGEFHRYGNYAGNNGLDRPQLPGYIDTVDLKYFYAKSSKKRKYTNCLSEIGIREKKIALQQLVLAFKNLSKGGAVTAKVQREIDGRSAQN